MTVPLRPCMASQPAARPYVTGSRKMPLYVRSKMGLREPERATLKGASAARVLRLRHQTKAMLPVCT